jgi:hypothetical protein
MPGALVRNGRLIRRRIQRKFDRMTLPRVAWIVIAILSTLLAL